MNGIDEALKSIISKIDEIYENVQTGNTLDGIAGFANFVECVQELIDSPYMSGSGINIVKLNEILNEIMEAVMVKDYFLMSDIMQYNLKPLLLTTLSKNIN